MSTYQEFLKSKQLRSESSGFAVRTVNKHAFPFQADIIKWALRKGKVAVFAGCGLGKTLIQLEWANKVQRKTKGRVLILAPLAVAAQTVREGEKFGIPLTYLREDDGHSKIVITNYEMLQHFDPSRFVGVVLDESSILKSYVGKTKRLILDAFKDTPYRLACTATPAPNDHLELGNHAEFLGIMPSTEMIMRWFLNDTMHAGGYRLKGHAEAEFWKWVTTWAVSIDKPSDLGYEDGDFELPGLELIPHMIESDHTRAWNSGELFLGQSLNATQMWREKRASMAGRVEVAARLANEAEGSVIVWCDSNDESKALIKAIPDAIEVKGSDSPAVKESRLESFSTGEARVIVTKSSIAGFGLNWQHAPTQVFAGLTYSFEKFYQALRRSYRFGQTEIVKAHIITSEVEGNIVETIKRKKESHEKLQTEMNTAIRKHGLRWEDNGLGLEDAETENASGDDWDLWLGDCVERAKEIADDSVDYSVFSPPFANLYTYSDRVADMGNCDGVESFDVHYQYLARELFRVIKPGRLVSIHCKDLPLYKNRDGAAGLYDFPGSIVQSMEAAGWTFHSRCTIWKDPVIEMQRTKNHGLLHKNFSSRREVVRMGMAEYVLTFRKWTEDMPDKQISHPVVPGEYIGTEPPENWDNQRDCSIQTWQKYASPIWTDIRQTNVLNVKQAREDKDEKHICPLQLDVIERCVWLWTNPGDLVLSPFAGIGSEGVVSLKMGRRFHGIELKRSYWNVAQRFLNAAKGDQLQMFAS